MPIKELKPEKLRRVCDPASLNFKTTKSISKLKGSIGHHRAISAINFGLNNKMKGFNIFLLGDPGSGKTSILRNLLSQKAKKEKTPPDWIHVFNFSDPNRPQAYCLPPGMGAKFRADLASLVAELKRLVPKLQEGERYLKLGQKIAESYHSKEARAFNKLRKLGLKNDLNIEHVSGELLIQVVKNGKPLDHEEFEELTAKERKYYEDKVRDIQDEISEFLRTQRKLEHEKQEKARDLDRKYILDGTEFLIKELKERYSMVEGLDEWLDLLWKDVPSAVKEFQATQEESDNFLEGPIQSHMPDFHQFRVNVLVNNKNTKGAPVVFESNPTFHNLLGSVEYQEQFGVLQTDFTLVRAGALHKANGGYLVIQVNDLMKSVYTWDSLKKSLRNKEIVIEELDIEQRTRSTVSPKPMPIPLQTKVILIGSYDAYYYLLNYDEDFGRLFKVKAEFDDSLPRTQGNIRKYAGFIKRLIEEDELLEFDAGAVAKVIEHASRLADNQKRICARFIQLINLVSESNYWAKESRSKLVKTEHIQRALKERNFRTGKIEFEMYEQISEGTVLIDTKGKRVGQINGIAVYDMGDHAFGIPSRITARTYVGQSGILNIDREVRLSGQIHSKASLILVGLIGGLYAQEKPISISASVCFEQMYGSVDGDSASCAELFALVSSLAELPINQGICVTGSLNQYGEMQPIGGVNEKIEGVYNIIKAKGLTGNQGVVIPVQNVVNLMLNEEIIESVKKGKFHIWAIKNIDQGLEILMGRPAKEIHKLVKQRLDTLREALNHSEEDDEVEESK